MIRPSRLYPAGPRPSRARPADRLDTPSDKPAPAQTQTWTAPVAGWRSADPAAAPAPGSADVLENFWPTASGVEPRGGSKLRATTVAAVESLFEYRAGATREFFAADNTGIYGFNEATPDGSSLSYVVNSQTSGAWSTLETSTLGGTFLIAVNGADLMQLYDGSAWQAVDAASSPHAITGVDTDKLSHVWAYGQRAFFVEGGTMDAWYLGVNSVSGAAARLPLAGVFQRGGALLFGATISGDSGAGFDDRCVFVTDQGEAAVYAGTDPASAATWALNGVYDIGEPLGPFGHFGLGGDLMIATKTGLVSLGQAMQRDLSQVGLASVSAAIRPDWERTVLLAGAGDWRALKWSSRAMAIIAPPRGTDLGDVAFALNLDTGAWCKITGWALRGAAILNDSLHFGHDAEVRQGDVGGTDAGMPFVCRMGLPFDALGDPAGHKAAHRMRLVWRGRSALAPKLSVAADHDPTFPMAPDAAPASTETQATWDVSDWDQDFWAEGDAPFRPDEKRAAVSGQGYALAPQVQVTSASAAKLEAELLRVDLSFTAGAFAP